MKGKDMVDSVQRKVAEGDFLPGGMEPWVKTHSLEFIDPQESKQA